MGLKSEKDKAIQSLYSQALGEIRNPFADYNLQYKPLTTEQLDQRTDEVYNQQLRQLRQILEQRRAEDLRGLTQRLVNQNILGSQREALLSRMSSQYTGDYANQLTNLGIQKAQTRLQNLLTASEQSKAYDQLMMQLLGNKFNAQTGKFGALLQLGAQLDDTTWLDDVLAVANTVGNILKGLSGV